jgi:molybdopterin molybdotransferase
MQENARIDESGAIHPTSSVLIGENIRSKGIDFSEGCTALLAGRRLGAAELMLAAAMNHATLPVARQPKIAIMASGDELTLPGKEPGPSQIIACNSYAVGVLARMAGANVIDLGVFCDNLKDLEIGIERAKELKADVLVTIGGASVGDHDLLRPALANKGMTLDFWRIAMRPGKPLIHGALGDMRILGLPGNPVASYVCSLVFLMPLIRALQGDPEAAADQTEPAIAGTNLSSNKARRDYMRASLSRNEAGALVATPHPRQDSSLITELAQSQALIVREAGADAVAAGAPCQIWRLPM